MGISSVIGILSLLGFVLFLAGIGAVVMAASQGRAVRGGVLLAVIGLVIGLVFSVISQGILIVEPTQVAVVVNTLNGDLEETPRRGGTHIIVPVIQVPFLYPVTQQTVSMDDESSGNDEGSVVARSSDGQEVQLDVSVIFSVDPNNANRLHLSWGQERYEEQFVVPTTRGVVRDAVSDFEAAEIYSGGREALSSSAFQRLSTRLERDGLILSDLIIRDVTFSQQYADAIEQAQVAAQESERARLQVERILQEAEQARARAQGLRDAEILRAEGEAQATVLQAQAEAEALRLVSEQIAANPSLLQFQYIQNLSDQVGLILVPTNSPFLFDLASLPGAVEDFSAPEVPQADLPEADLPEVEVTPEPSPGG
jgi:prohibitin 1